MEDIIESKVLVDTSEIPVRLVSTLDMVVQKINHVSMYLSEMIQKLGAFERFASDFSMRPREDSTVPNDDYMDRELHAVSAADMKHDLAMSAEKISMPCDLILHYGVQLQGTKAAEELHLTEFMELAEKLLTYLDEKKWESINNWKSDKDGRLVVESVNRFIAMYGDPINRIAGRFKELLDELAMEEKIDAGKLATDFRMTNENNMVQMGKSLVQEVFKNRIEALTWEDFGMSDTIGKTALKDLTLAQGRTIGRRIEELAVEILKVRD